MQPANAKNRKDTIAKQEIRKILIIKGPGIGDVVTAIPLARNFKQKLGCEVHILEEFPPEKQGKIIMRDCPYIDKIMRLNYNIWYITPRSGHVFREIATLRFIPDFFRFIRDILKLRKQKYDLVLEGFPGTKNTYVLTRLIAPKYRFCCSSHPLKKRYDAALEIRGKTIVELENSVFEKFGLETTQKDLELEIFFDRDKAKKISDHIFEEHGIENKGIVVGITTGQGYKRWQNSKWAKFIESMEGVKIVLLGDSGQQADAEEIKKTSPKNITDLSGKLKLEETIAVMSRAKIFICTNGGLMWIAAALGLPTVVVSGPTPYWWDPHAPNVKVARKAGKAFYEQENYSWLQHARTEDVTVDDIVAAIKELGGNNGKKRY